MSDVVVTKRCSDCREHQPLSDFGKNRTRSDGYNNLCKECTSVRGKAHREKNLEKEKQRTKLWAKENPDRVALRQKRYRDNHPEKRGLRSKQDREKYPERTKARKKVAYALKTGRAKRPSKCSNCAKTKNIQAHHDDYSRPLEVRWLCPGCHKLADRGDL